MAAESQANPSAVKFWFFGLSKDARLLSLLARIVRAYRGGLGRGLPIGGLMSQHLANFYLDRFDRFVKETFEIVERGSIGSKVVHSSGW